MVIFHSYVKLPEGNHIPTHICHSPSTYPPIRARDQVTDASRTRWRTCACQQWFRSWAHNPRYPAAHHLGKLRGAAGPVPPCHFPQLPIAGRSKGRPKKSRHQLSMWNPHSRTYPKAQHQETVPFSIRLDDLHFLNNLQVTTISGAPAPSETLGYPGLVLDLFISFNQLCCCCPVFGGLLKSSHKDCEPQLKSPHIPSKNPHSSPKTPMRMKFPGCGSPCR